MIPPSSSILTLLGRWQHVRVFFADVATAGTSSSAQYSRHHGRLSDDDVDNLAELAKCVDYTLATPMVRVRRIGHNVPNVISANSHPFACPTVCRHWQNFWPPY